MKPHADKWGRTAPRAQLAGLALMLFTLLPRFAVADSMLPSGRPLPIYGQECGTCHMAYPPALLPATGWQRLMSGLNRHFGSDAALEPREAAQISQWLVQNAGTGKRGVMLEGTLRISEQPWFTREHREVAPDVWKRPAIKSAAQCNACHGRAEQGAFNERDIRIPR
jgi:mono/diheme cytochrome c family protein